MFGYSPVSAAVATQIVRTRTNLWQAPAPATSRVADGSCQDDRISETNKLFILLIFYNGDIIQSFMGWRRHVGVIFSDCQLFNVLTET